MGKDGQIKKKEKKMKEQLVCKWFFNRY